jgi:hypothetical protein
MNRPAFACVCVQLPCSNTSATGEGRCDDAALVLRDTIEAEDGHYWRGSGWLERDGDVLRRASRAELDERPYGVMVWWGQQNDGVGLGGGGVSAAWREEKMWRREAGRHG